MLSVGIDTRPLFFTQAGIAHYLRNLIEALFQVATEDRFTLLCPKSGRDLIPTPNVPESAWHVLRLPLRNATLEKVWENLFLPLGALSRRLDLIHFPRFHVPRFHVGPAVVTIHDLAFRRYPEVLTPDARRYFEQATSAAIKRADAIIAVSEQTRQDLIAEYGVAPERVYRVYNGVAPRFCPGDSAEAARQRVSDAYGLDTSYIFFLGTLEPRKNAEGLIEAFHRLRQDGLTDPILVLAGGKGWLYDTIFQTVEALGLESSVRFLGHVPDEDLPDLYRAARVFVWPSFYEGFGLPVLEAMACGTPVVTSNVSSLPEVAGDAALLVDPHHPDEIAAAIRTLFEDQALAQDLRQRGLRQAARFSWSRSAKRTLDVYHVIAG